MKRRDFVKKAAGAGLLILPSGTLFGQNKPSDKVNVALIGVWGRGTVHYNVLQTQNVVALCDVNERRTAEALQLFPKAKTYWDWRKLMDQKDVEAVIICTADHHHAFISNWALNRDIHVFCEKPIGISVEEVRTVRANYLKRKAKVATQHGTQRHSTANFERVRELVLDGAIGDLQVIHGWDTRELPRPGYPAGQGEPPSWFHYDQWIGPSPWHPYTPQYFLGPSGYNCLVWNAYRDFGVGQIGDMGSHTMDLLWNAIDAGAPTGIEPDMEVSSPYDPNICPVKMKVTFEHPRNAWRGPVKVIWYQGGLKPESPSTYVDVSRVSNGAIFEGTKGYLVADFSTRVIIPNPRDGDLTYYKHRTPDRLIPAVGGGPGVENAFGAAARPRNTLRTASSTPAAGRGAGGPGGRGASPNAPRTNVGAGLPNFGPDGFYEMNLLEGGIPPSLGLPNAQVELSLKAAGQPLPQNVDTVFQQEFLDACKGKKDGLVNGISSKTHVDFNYAGLMLEQMLLGLVAHRAGKRLEYDPVAGRITNIDEANEWLRRKYRDGWTLNG